MTTNKEDAMDTYTEAIAWWIERRKAMVEFFQEA